MEDYEFFKSKLKFLLYTIFNKRGKKNWIILTLGKLT